MERRSGDVSKPALQLQQKRRRGKEKKGERRRRRRKNKTGASDWRLDKGSRRVLSFPLSAHADQAEEGDVGLAV